MEFACPLASDDIRIHLSAQYSSAIKCVQGMRHKARDSGVAVVPPYLFHFLVRDWTRICYVIGFENIWIHPSRRSRIRWGYFFPPWRAHFKMSVFAAEFAGCVWTEAVSRKRKGCGFKNIRTRVDGAWANHYDHSNEKVIKQKVYGTKQSCAHVLLIFLHFFAVLCTFCPGLNAGIF